MKILGHMMRFQYVDFMLHLKSLVQCPVWSCFFSSGRIKLNHGLHIFCRMLLKSPVIKALVIQKLVFCTTKISSCWSSAGC